VTTYLLVDGENIDATLGQSVLGGRRPGAEERPRWDRVRDYAASLADEDVVALFFLNASGGNLPMSFVAALLAMSFRPIPLSSSEPGVKVVDVGIQRTLEALHGLPGDVLLASHDGDFLPQVAALLDGTRKVGILGFREFLSQGYQPLVERGLTLHDLEDDVRAFNSILPRVRIIALEDFDPLRYL
jgi:uncharacterized protein